MKSQDYCGILSQCLSFSIPDPARVGRMSRETYLPAGMEGVIVCPVQADPPVLYVNWTKDGNSIDVDNVSKKNTKQNMNSLDGEISRVTNKYMFPLCFCPVQFPGWMVNSEGSVFITTANDNAVGMYTCTAYNSYGTMGQSEPTQVILKVQTAFSLVRARPGASRRSL